MKRNQHTHMWLFSTDTFSHIPFFACLRSAVSPQYGHYSCNWFIRVAASHNFLIKKNLQKEDVGIKDIPIDNIALGGSKTGIYEHHLPPLWHILDIPSHPASTLPNVHCSSHVVTQIFIPEEFSFQLLCPWWEMVAACVCLWLILDMKKQEASTLWVPGVLGIILPAPTMRINLSLLMKLPVKYGCLASNLLHCLLFQARIRQRSQFPANWRLVPYCW